MTMTLESDKLTFQEIFRPIEPGTAVDMLASDTSTDLAQLKGDGQRGRDRISEIDVVVSLSSKEVPSEDPSRRQG